MSTDGLKQLSKGDIDMSILYSVSDAIELTDYVTEKAEDKLIYMLWDVAYTSIRSNKNATRIANHMQPLRLMLKQIEWRGCVIPEEIEEIDSLYDEYLRYGFYNWSVADEFKKKVSVSYEQRRNEYGKSND